jgi:hypothetical protein
MGNLGLLLLQNMNDYMQNKFMHFIYVYMRRGIATISSE